MNPETVAFVVRDFGMDHGLPPSLEWDLALWAFEVQPDLGRLALEGILAPVPFSPGGSRVNYRCSVRSKRTYTSRAQGRVFSRNLNFILSQSQRRFGPRRGFDYYWYHLQMSYAVNSSSSLRSASRIPSASSSSLRGSS